MSNRGSSSAVPVGDTADNESSGGEAADPSAAAGAEGATASASKSSGAAVLMGAAVFASSLSAATTSTTTTAAAPVVLNLYQKIAVLRTGDDTLTYEDAQGRWKSVKVQELGDIIHKATPLEQKHAAAKHDIPVPQINSVSSYRRDVPANYDLPNSYVRSQRVLPEEWLRRVDYVADAEDEQWLEKKAAQWNEPMSTDRTPSSLLLRHPSAAFSLEMLEVMLDALEKATGFETIVTYLHAESLILDKVPVLYQLFPTKRQKQQTSTTQQLAAAPTISASVTLKHVLREVYQYWVEKRSKLKRPLLRKFWPVTSTDDTNPHLVFRPREKEKYKLRKKRQNDLDAYMKLKQLRADFDNLRAIMELVKRREELSQLQLRCHVQVFRQRLRDMTDTSSPLARRPFHAQPSRFTFGRATRECNEPDVDLAASVEVPVHFDTTGRKAKRVRADESDVSSSGSRLSPIPTVRDLAAGGGGLNDPASASSSGAVANVAGRNYGEPAPLFLHPLSTREAFATSWEDAVPHLPTYHNTHASSTEYFRHRPRVGRGGRVCVDRLPVKPPPNGNFYYRAGQPLPMPEKRRLLDLLPRPLNYSHVSQRIQELVLRDEAVGDEQENDGDEVVVKVDEWLETDDPLWGDERFAIGPI